MAERPLYAALLEPADLIAPLVAALDGTGPAVLPLDPALPPGRIGQLIAELGPQAVLTPDGPHRTGQDGTGRPVAEGTAVVVVTSGSTGRPKGVELSAAALLHSARASLDRIGARRGERWLCCLPVTHIAGIQVLVRSLVAGTVPVFAGQPDPGLAASCGGTHVSLVPTQLRRLLSAGADLGPFGTILLGGAGAPARLLDEAAGAGGRVVTTYGMTETCGGCVYDGAPLDDVRVAAGPGGRIRIAGPVLFTGYRDRRGRAGTAIADGWFSTSDLGSVGPSGRLTVRGRADDVINTGGEKVIAGEVAAVLESCPAVRAAAVFGQPDDEWGERVTAVIEAADPAAPPDLAGLRAHVRGVLPASAAPRELRIVRQMPLLPSGKPDLRRLRTQDPG